MQSFSVSMGTMLNPSEKYSKSNCILCSEQALSAFKTVKTKKEQAYSQCAKALPISHDSSF